MNLSINSWFSIIIFCFLILACGNQSQHSSTRQRAASKKVSAKQTTSDKDSKKASTQSQRPSENVPADENDIDSEEDSNSEEEIPEESVVEEEASQVPKVSFAANIAPVVDAGCLQGCHPGLFAGNRDLTNFDNVKECGPVCLEQIESGEMPRGRQLTPEQIALFKQWAADGYQP